MPFFIIFIWMGLSRFEDGIDSIPFVIYMYERDTEQFNKTLSKQNVPTHFQKFNDGKLAKLYENRIHDYTKITL